MEPIVKHTKSSSSKDSVLSYRSVFNYCSCCWLCYLYFLFYTLHRESIVLEKIYFEFSQRLLRLSEPKNIKKWCWCCVVVEKLVQNLLYQYRLSLHIICFSLRSCTKNIKNVQKINPIYFWNSQFFQTFLELINLKSGREIKMQPCSFCYKNYGNRFKRWGCKALQSWCAPCSPNLKNFPQRVQNNKFIVCKFFSLVLRIIVKLDDVNEATGFGLWPLET